LSLRFSNQIQVQRSHAGNECSAGVTLSGNKRVRFRLVEPIAVDRALAVDSLATGPRSLMCLKRAAQDRERRSLSRRFSRKMASQSRRSGKARCFGGGGPLRALRFKPGGGGGDLIIHYLQVF
jgi:hypothetical protein